MDDLARLLELFDLSKKHPENEMLRRLTRFLKLVFNGEYMIRDVHEHIVPLNPNRAQLRIYRVIVEQAAAGKPVRVTILKARKLGASTGIQTLFSHLCAYYHQQRAVTIAHSGESTRDIFEIACRAAKHHVNRPAEPNQRDIVWEDVDSRYHTFTAGGVAVGAGGTPSALHLSEVPKWERNKEETIYNTLNSLPRTLTSVCVLESSAKGRDTFFEHWDASRGDPESEYEAIFLPWYFDEGCTSPPAKGFVRDDDELQIAARALRDGVDITDGMFQWRRNKIKEIGLAFFRQEYPSTPEEAVMASEGLILPGMRQCIIEDLPFHVSTIDASELVGGIDFGYADPCVIGNGIYRDQVLYLVNVWRATESLAEEQLAGLTPYTRYYCDPANLSERSELASIAERSGKKVRLVPAPRRKAPGEDIAALELKQVVRMAEQGRLRILREASEQLIIECDTLAWDAKTGKPDMRRSDRVGHYDTVMMLKYLVMGVESWRTEKPPTRTTKPSRRQQFSRI